MGKGGSKIQVVQYFMSSWWGFSVGPVDFIKRIRVGEKKVWEGTLGQSAVISVDDRDLFGGVKKEGGVFGTITFLNGKDTQTIPEYLAAKLGLTSATCPAHRGIASLFFSGGATPAEGGEYGNGKTWIVTRESDNPSGLNAPFESSTLSDEKGFYWHANTPTIAPVEITAQRSPKVLSTATRMIGDDANPIHMIYETFVNDEWGMGSPASSIDTTSFTTAAQTVFDEGIGVSLLWTAQQSCEDFAASVLEYVDGLIFVNPSTGLLQIKLIRGDYDINTLFEITPENAKLTGYQRKLWGETINEIVVTWTNPKNEEEETVTVQDLGNIAMQGGVVSDSKDYKGVRSAALAAKLGARDLRLASSPLMTCRAVVNRSAWNITPGDVVKVTWPEHGMSQVPMRVTEVDYGKSNDSAVKLNLIEDVFGLDAGEYHIPPDTAWQPTSSDPTPLDHSLVTTMPYYLAVQSGVNFNDIDDPEVMVAVLGADADQDINQYLITYETSTPNGATVWTGSENRSLLSRATISDTLPFSAGVSTVNISNVTSGYGVTKNCIALLGTTDENQELCLVSAVSATGVTLKRGLMDTTPKVWAAGTPIWFIPLDADIMDDTPRLGDMEMTYKLLSMTSTGVLSSADAPELSGQLTRRPWLPLRPANCKVNGATSGPVGAIGATSLSLTWSTRNRKLEDTVLLQWNGGSTTPESGQTTTIQAIAADGSTVLGTIDGLSGTSYSLDVAIFGGAASGYVKFLSKNAAGDASLQGHMISVTIA